MISNIGFTLRPFPHIFDPRVLKANHPGLRAFYRDLANIAIMLILLSTRFHLFPAPFSFFLLFFAGFDELYNA